MGDLVRFPTPKHRARRLRKATMDFTPLSARRALEHLPAPVVDLDSRRPHIVGAARCDGCGRTWVAVVDARAEPDVRLECHGCHEMRGTFVETDA